jgi:hypothetical protein
MAHIQTSTLYRPVGPEELELIKQADWGAFPPRLPEQPIFYPDIILAWRSLLQLVNASR